MTSINKQKFLAELGKLLTFMYDEDRERAVAMYMKMFEEAKDEVALLQTLVSPTRQAVVVARAYNSNLGRLSLSDGAKAAPEDRDVNGVPDYVQAIEAVRAKALAAQGVSLKEEAEEPQEEAGAPAEAEEEPQSAEESAEELPEEEAADESESEAPAEEKDEDESRVAAAEEAPVEEAPVEEASVEEAPAEEAPVEETAVEETPVEEAPVEEIPVENAPQEEPEGKLRDSVETFTLPAEGMESPEPTEDQTALSGNDFNVDNGLGQTVRRKPRVFLLILYILLAIPVTICGIAVLLLPTILFLGLSVAAIICGAVLVSAALNGFAVLADIMVLLGLSLVIFALGLLFLWTSIWFIGGAIVGLVHGVAALCDKWCYKEVLEG